MEARRRFHLENFFESFAEELGPRGKLGLMLSSSLMLQQERRAEPGSRRGRW